LLGNLEGEECESVQQQIHHTAGSLAKDQT
jgi:hypothetical protein